MDKNEKNVEIIENLKKEDKTEFISKSKASDLKVEHHSAILENKIFEKKDRIIKKTSKDRLTILKNKEDIMDIDEIEDLMEVEYVKPREKKKNKIKTMFGFLFE